MPSINNHQENEIKTSLSYYFIPPRIAIITNKQADKRWKITVGEDVEKLELMCTAGENVKQENH